MSDDTTWTVVTLAAIRSDRKFQPWSGDSMRFGAVHDSEHIVLRRRTLHSPTLAPAELTEYVRSAVSTGVLEKVSNQQMEPIN